MLDRIDKAVVQNIHPPIPARSYKPKAERWPCCTDWVSYSKAATLTERSSFYAYDGIRASSSAFRT
jgi:hypothetical protein